MRKSSLPPSFFDILGLLLQLCLVITKPYYFCSLCLWFHLQGVCQVTEWQLAMSKKIWPNNWQIQQHGKKEQRTNVLKIGLMRRSLSKFNLSITSWTAMFYKVYIYKLNIKLVFPKSKLCRCKIANEKC